MRGETDSPVVPPKTKALKYVNQPADTPCARFDTTTPSSTPGKVCFIMGHDVCPDSTASFSVISVRLHNQNNSRKPVAIRNWIGAALLFLFALLPVGQRSVAQVIVVPSISTVAGNGYPSYSGDGISATSAELNDPPGVAVDSAGNIYIADQGNNRIRKVDTSGNISTVAGNGTGGYSGDGGAAISAELYDPTGVAVDSAGNIYIADSSNNRIRKVNTSGNISTVAGNGTGGYSGDGAAATSAELYDPTGVAVDSAGNIYIAEQNNNRIRKVSTSGNISTVAGNGTKGYSGDGGAAISAELNQPAGVAVDSAGNIYIADYVNHSIRKVDTSGKISTVAGDGPGNGSYNGDGILATSAELYYPSGVAVDSAGNIYIADTINYRIRKVDASTGYISTVAGNGAHYGSIGDGGAAISAQLYNPEGVVVDSAGNIYIADSGNHRIRKVGTAAIQFAATAIGSSTTRNVVLQLTSTLNITGIAAPQSQGGKQEFAVGTVSGCTVDATGATSTASGTICTVPVTFTPGYSGLRPVPLQVSTHSGSTTTVYAVALNGIGTGPQVALTPGTISTAAGNGSYGYSGDGGAATSAKLSQPYGVAVDSAGNIYIADEGNYSIRKVTVSTGKISTVAGTGTQGSIGDGGAATSAGLSQTFGVAVDSAGNIYIADIDNQRIRKVDTAGKISTVAGNGTYGYSGDGGAATSAELHSPYGVAVDSAGNIYIADSGNSRIRKVDASTGKISTVAGDGTLGYSGDGGAATSAELYLPQGMTVDSAGNIYIADYYNNRIRKVDTSGNISTVAGDGTLGYSGDGGAATSAELYDPSGVAVDSAGNIYIADEYNHRIRKVEASTGKISTVAGNGTGGYSGDGSAATSAELYYPHSVAVDSAGNIYIADDGNNRIRKVDVSTSSLRFATATNVGSTDTTDGPQTATISNIGNSALTLAKPTTGTNPSISMGFALNTATTCPQLSTSSSTSTLASGASCTLAVDFTPTAAGSTSGSVVLTDNSLNATNATQAIALGGTAPLPVPTQLVFTTPPTANIAPGGNAGSAVTVSEEDNSGDLATGSSDAITLTVAGPGSYSKTYTQTASGGVATFNLSNVALNTAGSYTYAATFGVLTQASATENVVGTSYTASTTSTGMPSGVQTATILFSSTYALNSTLATAIQVLTLGAPNLDFAYASGGTCAAGTTYSAGLSCTVNYTFTPKYPGQRLGAILLYDNSATPVQVATVYLSGMGTGPMVTFPSNTTINTLGGGFQFPYGVALDGNGDVFVADMRNNLVKEIPAGCASSSCVTTLGGGFGEPDGVAVDGAGNVYVADHDHNFVKEMPRGCASSSCVSTLGGIYNPTGIAVDGAGNVYVTDNGEGFVKEMPSGCASSSCMTTLGGGFIEPSGVAVDGAGNVYIADYANNRVKEMPSGCASSSCVSTLGGGFHEPSGVAVDGAGNVYVADMGNSLVKEMPSGCASSSCVTTLGGVFSQPFGVAVDGAGNVFVADMGNSLVKEIPLATPPSLTFASTFDGTTSSAQTVTLANSGNASLTFPIPTTGNDPSIANYFTLGSGGSACPLLTTGSSSGGTLASGASCTLPIGFAPTGTTSGTVNGSLVLTDNNLNATNATQTISLTGTATPVPTATQAVASKSLSVNQTTSFTPVTGSGGTAPLTYSVSPALPAGLSMTSATGTIAGQPTAASSTTTYTVTVTDSNSLTGTATFQMSVSALAATLGVTASVASPSTVNTSITYTAQLSGVALTPAHPTGTVTFAVNGSASPDCPAMTVSTTGQATCTTAKLAAGANQTITATYSGDTRFTVASAGTATQTVSALTATLGMTASPSSSTMVNDSVIFTAQLAGVAFTPVVPSGTVNFTANGSTISGCGAVSVNASGRATCTTSSLAAGSDPIAAAYSGDNNFTAAAAGTMTQTVTATTATTAAIASLNYSPSSQTGSLSATVTSGSGTVNVGTVTFSVFNGATQVGTAVTSGTVTSGAASVTYTLPAGTVATTYSIHAVYNASAPFATSSDSTHSLMIGKATPSIAWATPSAIPYGTALSATQLNASSTVAGTFVYSPLAGVVATAGSQTLSVTFTPTDTTDYTTATSTVTLVVNKATPSIAWATPSAIPYGTALSATQLNASSTVAGTFVYSPLAGVVPSAGSQTLSVTFTPTDTTDYTTATSTVTLVVNKATPSIAFTAPSPVTYGTAPIALFATGGASGNAVTFSVVSGPGSITGNTLTINGAGSVVVAANQLGNTNYTAAAQVTQSIVVNQTLPAIAVASSANPVLVQNAVTFTAIVSSAVSTPTGTMTFEDGATVLGSGMLAAGVATFTTSNLTVGTHTITAVYSGDGNFAAATSACLTQTIQDFNLNISTSAGSTVSQTVVPGGTATYTLIVTPTGGTVFPAQVNFTISGLPAGATATFAPPSLAAGSGTTTVTLTVNVPQQTGMLAPGRKPGIEPFGRGLAPITLGILLLPFAGKMRRSGKRLGRLCCLLLLLLASAGAVAGLSGCGIGNGFNGQPQTTSNLTVTATSGVLSHTITLTFTVQ